MPLVLLPELSDPRFPDIQPEEITGYELVYEQEIGRHLRSSLSGFYNQMNRLADAYQVEPDIVPEPK